MKARREARRKAFCAGILAVSDALANNSAISAFVSARCLDTL